MKIVWLYIGTVFIVFFIFAFLGLIELIELRVLDNRARDGVVSAAISSFTAMDIETAANRKGTTVLTDADTGEITEVLVSSDEEERFIVLNKPEAIEIITQHIIYNLDLDDTFYPKDSSFIKVKDEPVIIEKIEIVNPGDPSFIDQTTIIIDILIPVEVMFVGKRQKEMQITVTAETFYSIYQRGY